MPREPHQMDAPDATVRELIASSIQFTKTTNNKVITFDFTPDECGEHVLLVTAVGKDARNTVARLLNTFMDYEEDENELEFEL